MKNLFFAVLSSLTVLCCSSCTSGPADKIRGNWEVVEMQTGDAILDKEQLGSYQMDFNKDMSYSINLEGYSEKGRWKADEKSLTFIHPEKGENTFDIVVLGEEDFYYTSQTGDIKTTMRLKRISKK